MAKEQYVPLQAKVAATLDETAPVQDTEALLEWVAQKIQPSPLSKEEGP